MSFDRGFYMQEAPALTRIGDDVRIYPNCFIQVLAKA